MDNLVPIGRFSKISRLSISSLRYYDELGLLRPELVDPDSSYRYYRLSQVRTAEMIRLLRALEMPLDEVRQVLASGDPGQVRELLNQHQRRMEERLEEQQRILAYLRRLQGEDEPPAASPVRARELPSQTIICIHGCVPEQEVSGVWRALADELRRHVERCGSAAAGPIGAIFPDAVHREDAVNLTVYLPVSDEASPRGRIAVDTLTGGPAATIVHSGPYTLLHRSYHHLADWMQRHGHEVAGPPREIYWRGPAETSDPNDYETEVVWPIR